MADDEGGDRFQENRGNNVPMVDLNRLPPRLTPEWLQQAGESLILYRERRTIVEGFLINLRDRFRTRWELELLDSFERRMRKEIESLKAVAEYEGVRTTLRERADTEALQAKSKFEQTKSEYETMVEAAPLKQRTARLEEENKLLRAELANRELHEQFALKSSAAKERPDEVAAARDRTAREELRKQATHDTRMQLRLKWREEKRRERDQKIQAIRAETTLNEETKTVLIEELEDQYAQLLARGYEE